jgi:hypothetical protein
MDQLLIYNLQTGSRYKAVDSTGIKSKAMEEVPAKFRGTLIGWRLGGAMQGASGDAELAHADMDPHP